MDDKEIQRFIRNLIRDLDRSSFPVEVIANQMTEYLTDQEGAVFAAMAASYLVQYWVRNMNTIFPSDTPEENLLLLARQVSYQTLIGSQLFSIYNRYDPTI